MNKKKNRHSKKSQSTGKPQEDTIKNIEKSFEEIFTEDYYGKDFQFLVNIPVSENDHFVFKSEKTWTVDVHKHSKFFEINLKKLSAAIQAVPFNETVTIADKYFTNDQLTNINNKAANGKEAFAKLVQTSEILKVPEKHSQTEVKKDSDELTDELDFLLSLEEPVCVGPTLFAQTSSRNLEEKPNANKKENIDLEKWLDSVLED